MPAVIPDTAELDALSYFLGMSNPETLIVCLYSNNITPSEADTTATYVEVTGGGYASQAVAAAEWTLTPGNPSQANSRYFSWTFNAAVGNVYGYYVKRATSGKLAWAERFLDGPYNVVVSGDIVQTFLSINLE